MSRKNRVHGVVFAVLTSMLLTASAAHGERNFSQRFSVNDTGDILLVANANQTCQTSQSGCTTARDAGPTTVNNSALTNNNLNMVHLDIDGDGSTFNSSSAQLSLPAGSSVLFAGLYWGGNRNAGNVSSAPDAAAYGTVKFKPPGSSSYISLTDPAPDTSTSIGGMYQGFKDVTSLVAAAGSGTYTVADIQAGQGTQHYAGWTLVIAYRDTTQPARNLSVFDGLRSVTGSPVDITVSGFLTPPSGPVNTRVGVVAYEGDLGTPGDTMTLNGQSLSDAQHPASNVFDSKISRDGALVPGRTPSYNNNLGYDSFVLPANGTLNNSQTSATIRLSTSGDVYGPGVVTFATELHAPKIAQTKTVTDVNGGQVEQGDILTYTVSGTNNGQDGASNFIIRDPIPSGTSFVPGSLTVGGVAKTDAGDADTANFDGTAAVFRPGTGAGGVLGGTIAPGASYSVSFQVRVNGPAQADHPLPPGFTIVNTATSNFFAQTTGTPLSTTSSVSSTVTAPDLAINKTRTGPAVVAGGTTQYTIEVDNLGDAPTQGTVTVEDLMPSGFTATAITAPGWTCTTPPSTDVTCTRSDALAAGDSYPDIVLDVLVPLTVPSSVTNTAIVSGGGDGKLDNNTSEDTSPSSQAADLSLTKTASAPVINIGDQVTYTLTATNNGPSNATSVAISDTLPAGMSYVSSSPACAIEPPTGVVTCSIGSLAPLASAVVTITVKAERHAGASTQTNTATVGGQQVDSNLLNNRATADVEVTGADLEVAKVRTGAAPVQGGPISYELTVTNHGPSDATDVVMIDTLPAELTGVSTDDPANCTVSASEITCTVGALAAGATKVVNVTATVSNTANSVTNKASVSGAEPDPDPTDNEDETTDPVTANADLNLTKVVDTPNALPGATITYTITTVNNGPGDATGVEITDELHADLEFDSASPGCSYDSGTRIVTCTVGAMANGDNDVRTITATIAAGATGTIPNTATATSTSYDPNPSNNADGAVVQTGPPTVSPPTGPGSGGPVPRTTDKYAPLQYELESHSTSPAEAVCELDNNGVFFPCGTDAPGGGPTAVSVPFPDLPLKLGVHQVKIWAEHDGVPGVDTSGPPLQSYTWRLEPKDYETNVTAMGTIKAYWKLDESQSGMVAADATGNHPGDYKNYVVKGQEAAVRCERQPDTPYACEYQGVDDPGSSAYFGGRDDHVQLENMNNPANNWTVSAWVKPDFYNEERGIFEHIQTVWATDDNRFACKPLNAPHQTIMSAPYAQVDFQKWHLVSCALDNGTLKLYVDGELVDSVTGVTNQFSGGAHQGFIGMANQTAGKWWKGLIDNVSYHSSALTAAQISCLWQTGAIHDGKYAPSAAVDVDVAPPVARIDVPENNAQYSAESSKLPLVSFVCGDPQFSATLDPNFQVTYTPIPEGPDCSGTQPNGQVLNRTPNTTTTFTVNTTDGAGNTWSHSHTYTTHAAGSGFRDLIMCEPAPGPVAGCEPPLAYFRFEDAAGSHTMQDETGTYHGEYRNDQDQGGSGISGDATANNTRAFFGLGGYGAANGIPEPATGYTMEGWFNPRDVDGPMMLMQHGGSGAVWLDDGDAGTAGFQPRILFRAEERDDSVAVSDDAITAGDWWHVVATYDGIKARLYVNPAGGPGPLALPVEPDDVADVHFEPSGSDTFYVGYGDRAGGSGWFRGEIDEVSYYAAALSPAKVKEHYDADPPPPAAAPKPAPEPAPAPDPAPASGGSGATGDPSGAPSDPAAEPSKPSRSVAAAKARVKRLTRLLRRHQRTLATLKRQDASRKKVRAAQRRVAKTRVNLRKARKALRQARAAQPQP